MSIRFGNGDVTIDQLYVLSFVVSGSRHIALPNCRVFDFKAFFELIEIVLLRFRLQDLLGFAGIDSYQLDVVVVGYPEDSENNSFLTACQLMTFESLRQN